MQVMLFFMACTCFDAAWASLSSSLSSAAGFGRVVAVVQDVDGDSVADWVVGPEKDGALGVLSGRDESLLLMLNVAAAPGRPCDKVATLGDIDGDHRSDLLLSSSDLCAGTTTAVRGADGQVQFTVRGSCATVLGDVNADGIADFVVASPNESSPSKTSEVSMELRSGRDGQSLSSSTEKVAKLAPGFALFPAGDVDGDGLPDFAAIVARGAVIVSGRDSRQILLIGEKRGRAPKSVLGGADFDGDEHQDLLVAYPNEANEDEGRGFVIVSSGFDGRELDTIEVQGGFFGWAMRLIGDADGDGVQDFVVASHGESFVDPLRMFSGRTRKKMWTIDADFDQNCHREPALALIADQDKDGVLDLLVGAPASAGRCMRPGYVEVVSGKTGKSLRRIESLPTKAAKETDEPR